MVPVSSSSGGRNFLGGRAGDTTTRARLDVKKHQTNVGRTSIVLYHARVAPFLIHWANSVTFVGTVMCIWKPRSNLYMAAAKPWTIFTPSGSCRSLPLSGLNGTRMGTPSRLWMNFREGKEDWQVIAKK